MAQSPTMFFKVEDLPEKILLQDPSHLFQEEVLTLWDFWTSHQKDGNVGLIFSGCDLWDKRKDVGNMLTWKAKGKRLNLKGHYHSPSLSDDEDDTDSGDESFEDEVGREVGSLTKGKGKSANPKGDNNTVGPQMDDPDPDKRSQGINALGQVHLAGILHIPAPVNAGDSKDERLFFLAQLSKEGPYQAMVQWLKDHLVPLPLLYCECHSG